LKREDIAGRIQALLGDRAPQFTSSLLALTNSSYQLSKCEPRTVLASAMVAATLDLPINPNLGFAYIIPYGTAAQFQMGYKGFIQLAMRTGQYQRMNAVCVNQEAIAGTDDVGEPVILWDKIDETKPVVGYVFAFKLVNGFTKVAYWTKAKVEAHATRYSQAYKAQKKDSPWMTNFDSQGLKTVIKNTLAKWGILSVAMQKAIEEDAGTRKEIGDDAPPLYLDNAIDTPSEVTEVKAAPSIADRAKASAAPENATPTPTEPPPHPPAEPEKSVDEQIAEAEQGMSNVKFNKALRANGINVDAGEEWKMASTEKKAAVALYLKSLK
jgi:recombination protein RecT